MKRFDLIIVGAGPSGLSAAIEAAKRGLDVVVFDENEKPGGQLFKQIHKFFGSKEHKAKIRGFKIGEDLLKEADAAGVKVVLNATVCGMYQDKEITVRIGEEIHHYKGDAVIIATGYVNLLFPSEVVVNLSFLFVHLYVGLEGSLIYFAKERSFSPSNRYPEAYSSPK